MQLELWLEAFPEVDRLACGCGVQADTSRFGMVRPPAKVSERLLQQGCSNAFAPKFRINQQHADPGRTHRTRASVGLVIVLFADFRVCNGGHCACWLTRITRQKATRWRQFQEDTPIGLYLVPSGLLHQVRRKGQMFRSQQREVDRGHPFNIALELSAWIPSAERKGYCVKEFSSARILRAHAAVEEALLRHAQELSAKDFYVQPSPASWSVGHCLEHLVLTGEAFLPVWRSLLAGAPAMPAGAQREAYSLWGRIFLRMLRPPYRLRFRTSGPFIPAVEMTQQALVDRFKSMHAATRELVELAAQKQMAGRTVVSPFDKRVRYRLDLSFDIVVVHEERHAWQAAQIRQKLGI